MTDTTTLVEHADRLIDEADRLYEGLPDSALDCTMTQYRDRARLLAALEGRANEAQRELNGLFAKQERDGTTPAGMNELFDALCWLENAIDRLDRRAVLPAA